MKPLFTVHAGEFLVGDHINSTFGQTFDVWVPTKDTGVDLLVTRKAARRGTPVGLQVKFSRSFSTYPELAGRLRATSWFTLDRSKVRASTADLWVFVIMTLQHVPHFVVIPTTDLRQRMPMDGRMSKWNLYLWVYDDGRCYEVRSLNRAGRLATAQQGIPIKRLDFSQYLERWTLLDLMSKDQS